MRILRRVLRSSCICLLAGLLSIESAAQDFTGSQTSDTAKQSSSPLCVDCPPPPCPAEAQNPKVDCVSVLLEVVVTEKGKVLEARVLKDPGYGLGKKALQAVKKWQFKPAIGPNGKPVMVKATVEVGFKLPQG